MKKGIIHIVLIAAICITGCKTKQAAPVPAQVTSSQPDPKVRITGPAAIIYKTKADYSQYVPVTLSDDKTKIVSYPAPQDLYYAGNLATPTVLANGYLLDNRGISPNTAFIKITYSDYAKLASVPDLTTMYNMIIDKSPFSEMYNIGKRSSFADPVNDINTIIKNGELKNYTRIL